MLKKLRLRQKNDFLMKKHVLQVAYGLQSKTKYLEQNGVIQ